MGQPQMMDFRAIIDLVRRVGAVHYLKSAVPGDYIEWRRRLRQCARVDGLAISVTRTRDFVVVENRDYATTDDEAAAVADVVGGLLTGERVSFVDALYRQRRQRLRVVPSVGGHDDDHPR